jgi:glycosyltransferase involved in cell wall biosynthesis
MPAVYRQADVFLHMSQAEPFGIVYLEAAASGLPVVTRDGAAPRWILGDTAVYVDGLDPPGVARGIRAASDPAVRCRLARKARQRVVSDWTWQVQAEKYRRFLRSLVEHDREQGHEHAFDHHRELQHA